MTDQLDEAKKKSMRKEIRDKVEDESLASDTINCTCKQMLNLKLRWIERSSSCSSMGKVSEQATVLHPDTRIMNEVSNALSFIKSFLDSCKLLPDSCKYI